MAVGGGGVEALFWVPPVTPGNTADWIAPGVLGDGGAPSGGTVTSVGLALPVSVFSVSGSPVTTAGTLTGAFLTQTANTLFAGPSTGAAAVPAFRSLVVADLPDNIPNSKLQNSSITLNAGSGVGLSAPGAMSLGTTNTIGATTDTVRLASLGLGVAAPASGILNVLTGIQINSGATSGNYLRGNGTNFISSTIQSGDLPGSFSGFANPTATIGTSAVNGSATTAMRSDAAPALASTISAGGPTGSATVVPIITYNAAGQLTAVSTATITYPGSFSGFANPSASVGLSAVNGSATTAMRSDAAPALDQAIAPTWTARHIFNVNGAVSAPPVLLNGTILTGGTATTNFPNFFLQPSGTTAVTTWSTSGTGLGMNLASGFAGNFLDFHVAGGASVFRINSGGAITSSSITAPGATLNQGSSNLTLSGFGSAILGPAGISGSLQYGAADAAAPVAQMQRVQSVVAGTSNTAAQNWTLIGSLSTGNGVSGDIIFQTGGTGAGATSQNTATTALTIKGATQELIFNAPARLKGYTVATLPAGNTGDTAYVTDALAPTFLVTIVGGGAVVTPVFYNGANWVGY